MNETGKNPFEPKRKGNGAVLYENFLKHAAIFALAVSVTFSLKACDKEEIPTSSITMTTQASKVSFSVAGAKDIVIDWGDGKTSSLNDAFFDDLFERFWFTHDYSGTTARTIVISGNVAKLTCVEAGLTALDVSRNTALTDLNCRSNQLTALDVTRNTALTYLDCSQNQLTALDMRKNTALKRLECDNNQLKSLDMSKNTVLRLISCACNLLTASALNDLFRTLPSYPGLDYGEIGNICISQRNPGPADNPGILDCDRSIAEEKGWVFRTIK